MVGIRGEGEAEEGWRRGGGGERKAISCQQGMAVGHSNRPLPPLSPTPTATPTPTTRLPCLLHSCQASKPAFKWRLGHLVLPPSLSFDEIWGHLALPRNLGFDEVLGHLVLPQSLSCDEVLGHLVLPQSLSCDEVLRSMK